MLKGRLKAIADMIIPSEYLIDIGTDHAYIPVYAIREGRVVKAFASDVRVGPVQIAEKNILAAGLEKQITAVLSDGFEAFTDKTLPDSQAVIAGMGGTLITEILARGIKVATHFRQLILQPMNDIEYCREWLLKNGFKITDESLAKDMGKLYVILVVNPGENVKFEKIDTILGPCLKQGLDPLFEEYIVKLLDRRKKIIEGLKKSAKNLEQLTECQCELDLLERWRETHGI